MFLILLKLLILILIVKNGHSFVYKFARLMELEACILSDNGTIVT